MIPESHEISGLIRVPEMNGERSFALREISIFFCPAEEREKRKGKEFIITPVLPRLKSHWNAAEEKGERWLSLVIIRPPMKEECNDNFLLFSPAIRNSSLFSLVISLEIGKNLNESVAILGASAKFFALPVPYPIFEYAKNVEQVSLRRHLHIAIFPPRHASDI